MFANLIQKIFNSGPTESCTTTPISPAESCTIPTSTLTESYNADSSSCINSLSDSHAIPYGSHFLLFPLPSPLSPDGYSSLFTPPPPFKFRMWVGGKLIFHKNLKLNHWYGIDGNCQGLRDKVTKRGSAVFTDLKFNIYGGGLRCSGGLGISSICDRTSSTSTNSMTNNELVIEEYRNLIYLSEPASTGIENSSQRSTRKSTNSINLICSNLDLFQFSKLTSNCHKIHYDLRYAQSEGYQDLLVHGPLLTCLMLEFVHRNVNNIITGSTSNNIESSADNSARSNTNEIESINTGDSNRPFSNMRTTIKEFDYQCYSPCFVNQEFTISGFVSNSGFKVFIHSGERLIARGSATLANST